MVELKTFYQTCTILIPSELQSVYGRIEKTMRRGIRRKGEKLQSVYGRIEKVETWRSS